jgi:MoaA/NifB/PqqE/SkfB family radical SAM enzyme
MSNIYCTAPWRGLQIDPTGDVKVCCAGKRGALGNLRDSSIHEILSGLAVRDLRQTMLDGQVPSYCKVCTEAERYGNRSERHWHLEVDSDFTPINNIQPHSPSIIDARWNNTCNLKCLYCNSMSSSRWAAHAGLMVDSSMRKYYDEVESFVKNNSANLKEVALIGGEPLLLPENTKFLEVIPESTKVIVITNLSNDLKKNPVFQRLKNRSNVGWSISFENIGSRFEFVRDGANWHQFLENLEIVNRLRSDMSHTSGIHAVYNIFSATCLGELLDFADQSSLTINWQTLVQPEYFDPLLLGDRTAQLAINEIDHILHRNSSRSYEDYFIQIRDKLKSAANSRACGDFKMTMYHHRRDFVRLWPELEFLIS